MNWYLEVLQKKYAEFNGRARRKEFWMFVLINICISIAVGIVAAIIHLRALHVLYSLAVLVPCLAVSVRRLHDTNRSGWWLLLALIPLIGAIVLIVFYAQDSDPGENQFGPNPKIAA